jgi:hypothetical protein
MIIDFINQPIFLAKCGNICACGPVVPCICVHGVPLGTILEMMRMYHSPTHTASAAAPSMGCCIARTALLAGCT